MKIGIIGYGSMGRRRRKILKELGYQDIMIHDIAGPEEPEIHKAEVIFICTPPMTHNDLVWEFKGRHIFVEKPGLVIKNKPSGKVECVGYNWKFHPEMIRAKNLCDNGYLGIPIYAIFEYGNHWGEWECKYPIEMKFENHEFGHAKWLLGPLKGTYTSLHGKYSGIFTNNDGCHVLIHANCECLKYRRHYKIVGSKETIEFDLPLKDVEQTYIDETMDFMNCVDQNRIPMSPL